MQHSSSASLPSDYGLLTHYAAYRLSAAEQQPSHDPNETNHQDNDDASELTTDHHPTQMPKRRLAMPTIESSVHSSVHHPRLLINENTPLLDDTNSENFPSIPMDSSASTSNSTAFWAEFTILTKYTIPVFRYAQCHKLSFNMETSVSLQAHTYWNIVSSWHQWYPLAIFLPTRLPRRRWDR